MKFYKKFDMILFSKFGGEWIADIMKIAGQYQ